MIKSRQIKRYHLRTRRQSVTCLRGSSLPPFPPCHPPPPGCGSSLPIWTKVSSPSSSEQNPIFIHPQPSVCFLVVRGDAEEASCIKSKLTSGQPQAQEVSQPLLLMFLGGSRQRWDQPYLLLQLSRRTSSRPNPSEWINILFKLLIQPGESRQHWDQPFPLLSTTSTTLYLLLLTSESIWTFYRHEQ